MSEHLPDTNYLDPEVLQRLGDLELVAREVVEGLRVGSHRSPLRGFSTEFAHHRQYSPGDAIRDIDWRVFGRTDRYYTKLSDVDDILAGLDHLRYDGHNVVVLHTLDPYELEFPFKGTWLFEGLEGEEPLTTQPERIRDDYLASFGEYMEALKAGCVASHVDYTTVDTSRPLDAVLSEFFHLRQSTINGPSAARP